MRERIVAAAERLAETGMGDVRRLRGKEQEIYAGYVSGIGEPSSGEGRLDKKRDLTTRYLGPLRFPPVVESGQECWFVVVHWSFALDPGQTTISLRSIVRRPFAIEFANNYALCGIQKSLMNWQAFVWITV